MCGRYSLALSNEEVYDALQNQLPRIFQRQGGQPRWEREQDHRPNYNVAPRQRAPVIHRDHDSGEPIIETMQWGLVPHWTKHPPTGPLNTINARSEALLDASSGGMWHALKGYKRCIVPAQGYYEWHKRPSAKIAHFTRLPLTPKTTNLNPPIMFLAGLYDHVKYLSPVESKFQPREGDDRQPYPTGNPIPLATFTILTTSPAPDLEWLHDRMPCVLSTEEDIERWLDLGEVKGWEEGKGGTGELLRGKPGLECFPVNPEVGKIGNNSPTFIQPVSERSDGIKSFFQKQAPSPMKSKAQPKGHSDSIKDERAEHSPGKRSKEVKQETEEEIKEEARGLKTEIKVDGDEQDEEKGVVGIGDDSNAPNMEQGGGVKSEPKQESDNKKEHVRSPNKEEKRTPSKRKREQVAETELEEERQRKGGHQTKVIRKTDDDTKKAQPSITNFFKSPETKKAPVETRASRSKTLK